MKGKRLCVLVVGLAGILATASFGAQKQRVKSGLPVFESATFVSEVNNKLFPLTPGTIFFYEGEKDGVPASDEFQVNHRTKRILGVDCTEVRDQAFENGILAEDTLDWFAQDTDGNVWYFGEDTKELDANGNVISTEGSWEAGVNGALPGIIMLADPHKGDRYQQEFATGVAEDMARVLSLNKSASVPYGDFDDLLLTRESTPLEKGAVEVKYYAEGIGFILGEATKGGDEITELVAITTGNPDNRSVGRAYSRQARTACGHAARATEVLKLAPASCPPSPTVLPCRRSL